MSCHPDKRKGMNAWDPLAAWVSTWGLGSLVGAGWRVKFPLSFSLAPAFPPLGLPNDPSVHGSPVKPKAGNLSAAPLQKSRFIGT